MSPQKCAQCGAMIDPLALACPYCRFTTPAGVAADQQHQREAAWSEYAQNVQHAAARAKLGATATQALIFGILGIVMCCTPLGVFGIVQGFRARSMATAIQAPVPGRATAGLILAIVSIVTSIGGIIYLDREVEADKAVAAERAAVIEKRLGNRANEKVLTRETACDLVELHLLKEGAAGVANYNVVGIECIGRLEHDGEDRAAIDTVRFGSGTAKVEIRACLKRGGKWYVASTVTDAAPCP